MNRPAAIRIPRLPAAARKAGATQIARCSDRVFSVGFKIDGEVESENLGRAGHGPAVAIALVKALGDSFKVEWKGEQRFGIILTART